MRIEGKDGNINFADYFLQKRRRLHGSQALLMQGSGHVVDLLVDFAQRAAVVLAQTKREVPFGQSAQQISQGANGVTHALLHRSRETEPA